MCDLFSAFTSSYDSAQIVKINHASMELRSHMNWHVFMDHTVAIQ